jgi:hypothetical protein
MPGAANARLEGQNGEDDINFSIQGLAQSKKCRYNFASLGS